MTAAKVETRMEKSETIEVRVPLAEVIAAFVPAYIAEQVNDMQVSAWDDEPDELAPNSSVRTGVLLLSFRKNRRYKLGEDGVYIEEPKKPRDGCITTSKAEKIIEEKIAVAFRAGKT